MAELKSAVLARMSECAVTSRAFGIWLSTLRFANLLFVVGAGLLSLLAGASILLESHVISRQAAGFMALASAALTVVHNLLGCDHHQAECRRLRSVYEGLRTEYWSLDTMSDEAAARRRLGEIHIELAAVQKGAAASPARWCMDRAQREMSASAGSD